MISDGKTKQDFTCNIKEILSREPGLSVKELASRLSANRQFMAGFLTALEERGEVYHRQVGPAKIFFSGRQASLRSKSIKDDKTPGNIGSQ